MLRCVKVTPRIPQDQIKNVVETGGFNAHVGGSGRSDEEKLQYIHQHGCILNACVVLCNTFTAFIHLSSVTALSWSMSQWYCNLFILHIGRKTKFV